jgi:Uma2 family endonuclease
MPTPVDLQRLTYETYLALPEMRQRYAIIDGEVEVLSPTNSRQEVQEKLHDYQAIGVREAWIVSPEARTVEVLQLTPERRQRSGLYGLEDVIVSQVLPDFRLTVDEIFPEL